MKRDKIKEVYGEVLFDIGVELGRKKVKIGEMLKYDVGTVIRFPKTSGEAFDVLVNLKPLASGEIMVLDDKFSIRITDILTKEQLVDKFKEGLYD